MKMYEGYPKPLHAVLKNNTYVHQPDWNKNIEYYKEQERGYAFKEDLLVPGYFEMPIKKGRSIIFSGGVTEVSTRTLKKASGIRNLRRIQRSDMFSTLKNSAEQFYKRVGDKTYLMAGYPWFGARARDEFVSLVSGTILIDRMDYFDAIIDLAIPEIERFMRRRTPGFVLRGIDDPDVFLYFILAVQQFSTHRTMEEAASRFWKTGCQNYPLHPQTEPSQPDHAQQRVALCQRHR